MELKTQCAEMQMPACYVCDYYINLKLVILPAQVINVDH